MDLYNFFYVNAQMNKEHLDMMKPEWLYLFLIRKKIEVPKNNYAQKSLRVQQL